MESPEFDPYHEWLGIAEDEQPATYYRLLGIAAFESSVSVIESALVRQCQFVRQFQLGSQAASANRLLNELNHAAEVLLDAARRASYDEQLRAAAMPPTLVGRATETLWGAPGRRHLVAALLILLSLAIPGLLRARRGGDGANRGGAAQAAAAQRTAAESAGDPRAEEPQTEASAVPTEASDAPASIAGALTGHEPADGPAASGSLPSAASPQTTGIGAEPAPTLNPATTPAAPASSLVPAVNAAPATVPAVTESTGEKNPTARPHRAKK